jgi:hypothetical protein
MSWLSLRHLFVVIFLSIILSTDLIILAIAGRVRKGPAPVRCLPLSALLATNHIRS